MSNDEGVVTLPVDRSRDTEPPETTSEWPDTLPYKTLMEKHEEYDAGYMKRLRAFYKGGKKLLSDPKLLMEVFPRHRDEHPMLYQERCSRAFYIPYAAEIIDHLVSALTSVPVQIQLTGADKKPKEELPDFWAKFVEDCSPPGGEKCSLQKLVCEQILNALQVGRAWSFIDMPRTNAGQFTSLADQEQSGALDTYVVPHEAECVLDWETDERGDLEWVCIYSEERKRKNIALRRNRLLRRWMFWSKTSWARYELETSTGNQPRADTPVKRVDEGVHPFGRVPAVMMCLPEGLWAMSKLESPAREHFNKRNALSWGELQSLLPELYEFLGPEVPSGGVSISEAQEKPARAVDQERGQGFIQQRGSEDRAEWVGPPTEGFAHAMSSCNNLRDEMHRVTHQMALSVDNSAAALGRSADSKEEDRAAQSIVLRALSEIIREHACLIMEMAARGRGEEKLGTWHVGGADQYNQKSASQTIADAVEMTVIDIPSPTWKRHHLFNLAKMDLGANVSQDVLDTIWQELEENVELEMPPTEEEEGQEGEPAPEKAAKLLKKGKPIVRKAG